MTEFRMVDRVVGNIEAGTEAPLRFSAPNSRLMSHDSEPYLFRLVISLNGFRPGVFLFGR
jgi:hypothetical protein